MQKALNKRFVNSIQTSGKYHDNRRTGLYLIVKPSGRKTWGQRLTVNGKVRELGLGSVDDVSLDEARDTAYTNQRLARSGDDPALHKRGLMAQAEMQNEVPTFREAATIYYEKQKTGWSNDKHKKQWLPSLERHAAGLMDMRVDEIRARDVYESLHHSWFHTPETAQRVRQKISNVILWAIAMEYRPDTNPAGKMLSHLLPPQKIVKQHMRALPYSQVADAMETVKNSQASKVTRLAIELLVLTATRSGELRGAKWQEINMESATWTIPSERMKMSRQHRIPLSDRALEVLTLARKLGTDQELVFTSAGSHLKGRPISDNTLSKLMRDLGIDSVPHGFRSSFRQWCAECTDVPREVAELALAHVNGNRVEAAYQRSDLLEKRRPLMQQWADYITRNKSA